MWAARPHLANIFEKLLDQKTFICLRLVFLNGQFLQKQCFTWNKSRTAPRENNLQHPAKGGSTPAFACQRAAIAPLPCPNLQPYFSSFNFVWIGQFQKMQLQQEKQIAKTICFANVGYSPTPRQHFWKTAAPKNFLFCAVFHVKHCMNALRKTI